MMAQGATTLEAENHGGKPLDELCLILQYYQKDHDLKFHADVWNQFIPERLQHYALHLSKYMGEISDHIIGRSSARDVSEVLLDIMILCTSSANAVNVKIYSDELPKMEKCSLYTGFLYLSSYSGIYCKAVDKALHMEPYNSKMVIIDSVRNMFWVSAKLSGRNLNDIVPSFKERLDQVKQRSVFAETEGNL